VDRLALSMDELERCLLSKLMVDMRPMLEWSLLRLYQASIQREPARRACVSSNCGSSVKTRYDQSAS